MSARQIESLIQTALGGESPRQATGSPAIRPDLHGDLPGVPGAMGRALRRLHTVGIPAPVVTDSEGAGWAVLSGRIQTRLEAGRIVSGALPEPFSRYEPLRLVELWTEGRPATEQSALCLGEATLENLLMEHGEVVGCLSVDWALVADPHLDLARMHLSIHEHLGGEAVFGFYEAYGSDPDLAALDHYILANHLLGTTTGPRH